MRTQNSIYGKTKIHINLIEYITQQSKYHIIPKSNPAAASMSM